MINNERKDYSETGLLNIYSDDIHQFPKLEEKELIKLLRKAKEGDIKARNKIAQSFLRLIPYIIKVNRLDYIARARGFPIGDLYSDGNNELLKLIGRYDESKNVPFKSYAVNSLSKYIRGQLHRMYRNFPSRLSMDLKKVVTLDNKLREEGKRLMLDDIRNSEEISRLTADAYRFKVRLTSDLRLEDEAEFFDTIESKTEINYKTDNEFLSNVLHESLDKLDERSRIILEGRYGIGKEPMKLKELSKALGISKQRISQIQQQAEIKLKKLIYSRLINREDLTYLLQ